MNNKNIICRNCLYYYVTWDNNFPYGCKLFGIKSRQLPSIVVYQTSGKDCEGFVEKKK